MNSLDAIADSMVMVVVADSMVMATAAAVVATIRFATAVRTAIGEKSWQNEP